MTTIVVIDYGVGNIRSICSAIEKVGGKTCLSKDKNEILAADGVILPGVGAFEHGMNKLKEYNLDRVIREFTETGKPLLGICLGMQLLFEHSSEFGQTKGLGLIPGEVLRLTGQDDNCTKLPHIGWSEIKKVADNGWDETILDGIDDTENVYFVHSYYVKPKRQENILSLTNYSKVDYCSTVRHSNIYGCQYHPEKSALTGLKIINNFVAICRG